MRSPRVALVGLIACTCLTVAARGAAGDCARVIAGNDTTSWNTARGTFLGEAVGQTFYAHDTVVTGITVWRAPNSLDYTGAHLFITGVDSTNYHPQEPITQNILQDGPTVLVPNSDPPGLPIPMNFVIDPPLLLPNRGTYAFFIQREGCDLGEIRMIGKEPGTYPYGLVWYTARTTTLPCFLPPASGEEDIDLCFEIEYCREVGTPNRRETWGRLKVTYR